MCWLLQLIVNIETGGMLKMEYEAVWGCRHCGNDYPGSNHKGKNDKCPHCKLLQSKSFEEQIASQNYNKAMFQ